MTPPRAENRAPGSVTSSLKQSVVAYYERALERHGPTALGMDWKDEASQSMRFALLCSVCNLEGRSVHEVGAGAGHLADYLRKRGVAADYSGSDLSQAMVQNARHLHPGVCFEQRDLLSDPPKRSYDVVLCSGLFFVKLAHDEGQWLDFVQATLQRMFEMCRVAIAFNLMSDHVDFRAEKLFYSNPGETLDFCRSRLSPHVALRHDYPLYEYTTYVYREPVSETDHDAD